MAAMSRIALFLWNGPSRWREPLRCWAKQRDQVSLFTDSMAPIGDEQHYLRFYEIDRREPFDLILCDIADSAAHAAAFSLIVQQAPVLFLDDIRLHRFARAVSHDARDPWGTGWLLAQAEPGAGEAVARLIAHGIDPGRLMEAIITARALARRATAVILPQLDWAHLIEDGLENFRAEILPPDDVDWFETTLDRRLPTWIDERRNTLKSLPPFEHGNADLQAIERRRIADRCPGDLRPLAAPALATLDSLFAIGQDTAPEKLG